MKTNKCTYETSANDNHPAVEIELAAALLAQLVGHLPSGPASDPEARGWDDRCEDVIDDHEHTPGEAIGWLAHAIVNHDDEQAEAQSGEGGPEVVS